MNDIRADIVQERLVVRNHQERFLPVLEVVVQPDNRVQIQMIGRFVEHQQCRFNEQSTGERNTHAPTSGEFVRSPVLHLLVKSETGQKSACLGLGLVGANGTKFIVYFGQFLRDVFALFL